jgi:hypothetical protein
LAAYIKSRNKALEKGTNRSFFAVFHNSKIKENQRLFKKS